MDAYESPILAARWIGWSPVHVWGLVPTERLRRQLWTIGLWDAGPWTGLAPGGPRFLLLLRGEARATEARLEQ